MKKVLLLLACVCFIAACAGNKNNTLSAKASKYPVDKYITKIVSDTDKNKAKEKSLSEIKKIFDTTPPSKDSDIRREAILSKAYVAEYWKDKDTKKYYAIAVLEREPAQKIIEPFYASIDGQLASKQNKVLKLDDKYARLKEALAMPDLFAQRAPLDSEYKLLTFDASAYNEELLYSYKATYNKAFYDIKINSIISGIDDTAVKTYIIDQLNKLGFAVGEELPLSDIELLLKTKADEYPSKSTDGLYWCTATATVSLKDMETKGIFATFSTAEKVGSFRPEEAQRRSLIAVGEKSAPIIKEKLLIYVEKK